MLKIIRNNEKKFLAGFTILLTLTFVVTSGTGRGNGRGGAADDRAVGTIGGKDLRASEVNSARAELAAVERNLHFAQDAVYEQRFGADLPFMRLFGFEVGHDVIDLLRERPELFAVLRREAEAAGMRANSDEVNDAMGPANYYGPKPEEDADAYNATRQGVADVLAVAQNFDRIAGAAKVSRAAAANAAVRGVGGSAAAGPAGEQISLNLVNLAAADYLPTTPAPTTQQCQAQFDKFAGTTADHPSPADPFGFGYKYPVRMTAQYVRLTPEAVEAAVTAGRSAYDWEVAAREYYLSHPAEFQLGAAATPYGPTTAPVAGAVKAFDAVKDQATKAVTAPLVTALGNQVRQFVTARTTQDWQASQRSATPTAYAAPDYLHALAAEAGKRFQGVVLDVVDAPADQSVKQLDAMPQLLTLRSPDEQTLGGVLAQRAVDFLALKDPSDPAVRAVLTKPTPVLTSTYYSKAVTHGIDLGEGPVVIGRLVAAQPSQPPPDLAAVRPAVEADCRTAAAYDRAKADADQILAAAKEGRLTAGATAVNRLPVSTAALSYAGSPTATVPQLPPELAERFVHEAFDQLLAGYVPGKEEQPKPAALIALPDAGRVSVAQLLFVLPTWSAGNLDQSLDAAATAVRQQEIAGITVGWFAPDAIARRLDYKPVKGPDQQ